MKRLVYNLSDPLNTARWQYQWLINTRSTFLPLNNYWAVARYETGGYFDVNY